MSLLLYFSFLLLALVTLPKGFLDGDSERFIFVIGSVAVWRYGWAATHFVRSLVYRFIVFPDLRRRAEAMDQEAMAEHVYLLVTTFGISTDTTTRVYRAAIEEGSRSGIPTTVVASLVSRGDEMLVRALYKLLSPPQRVNLVIVRRPGTGKRDALASGFNAIARLHPPKSAVVAVIDGDSMLSPGMITRCVR